MILQKQNDAFRKQTIQGTQPKKNQSDVRFLKPGAGDHTSKNRRLVSDADMGGIFAQMKSANSRTAWRNQHKFMSRSFDPDDFEVFQKNEDDDSSDSEDEDEEENSNDGDDYEGEQENQQITSKQPDDYNQDT